VIAVAEPAAECHADGVRQRAGDEAEQYAGSRGENAGRDGEEDVAGEEGGDGGRDPPGAAVVGQELVGEGVERVFPEEEGDENEGQYRADQQHKTHGASISLNE
jgi:hypothetical protein